MKEQPGPFNLMQMQASIKRLMELIDVKKFLRDLLFASFRLRPAKHMHSKYVCLKRNNLSRHQIEEAKFDKK